MKTVSEALRSLFPVPDHHVRSASGNIWLPENAIIHKTGRSAPQFADTFLREYHRLNHNVLATKKPWTDEVESSCRGARFLFHQPDSHNSAGREVPDGGLFKAVIQIADSVKGSYLSSDGSREEAACAPCVLIAQSDKMVRFSKIATWNVGVCRSHPRGVFSGCPMAVWDRFVDEFILDQWKQVLL